ncbi:MAG: hypothetical protein BWY15_01878 [Firmicutes bacterium ADurb.Bin193]|nr:MAG: hypothetical protein BWY15_01878 [Firmicutes bacterium ADurb.Bin193]
MIDSNGRIFGKINIVDLIVIIAVIIALAGVYIRFFGGPAKTIAVDTRFYYTFKVSSIRESNLEALKKSIGKKFFLNERISGEMGRLLSVEASNAESVIEMANGELKKAGIPDRYDAILTFEMTGRVNDRGFFSPSLEDISAGIIYNIKGKYNALTGNVLRVWQE